MSEFEYLKCNKELKGFYNTFNNKLFPKQPHNKINLLMSIFKQKKKEICFKVNFLESGLELGPTVKFENGDRLALSLNEKMATLNTSLNLNYKKLFKVVINYLTRI